MQIEVQTIRANFGAFFGVPPPLRGEGVKNAILWWYLAIVMMVLMMIK